MGQKDRKGGNTTTNKNLFLGNPVNNLSIAVWGQKGLLYWYLSGSLFATESIMPSKVGLIKKKSVLVPVLFFSW